ncbi:MAG TPA: hypothetical protein VIV54_17730 [Burkholderiales bacterium]
MTFGLSVGPAFVLVPPAPALEPVDEPPVAEVEFELVLLSLVEPLIEPVVEPLVVDLSLPVVAPLVLVPDLVFTSAPTLAFALPLPCVVVLCAAAS